MTEKLAPGVTPVEEVKKLSGLDFLKAMIEGRLPPPPIAHHLGFTLTEAREGWALFTGTPGFHLYNPIGSVHGGYIATLLDSCMSCAIHTTVPVLSRIFRTFDQAAAPDCGTCG
ncbi:MAG: PaaI family thioesterase [Alphaproteobacteria bacterium]|nr:PaaI family thioesterase [Alphaproteobacteria bacterium]